jgi:hypothetical protein
VSYPKAVFIDTCIFDEAAYNFSSPTFRMFCDAVKGKGLQLLLPDPTVREINRHIDEQVTSAIKSLEDAQRKAPFLKKVKDWPLNKDKVKYSLNWSIRSAANRELKNFYTLFDLKKLGYQKTNITEIMDWYDKKRPPFGEGQKRKEFPDALAIALVRDYANDENVVVAVISKDSDIKKACELYHNLFCYKSLSSYAEVLQTSNAMFTQIQELLDKDTSVMVLAINEHFPSLSFYIEANIEGDSQDIEVDDVEFVYLDVVGIGEGEVSIGFRAKVSFSAYVSYDNLETASYDSEDKKLIPWEQVEGTVHDSGDVSGIMKCKLTADKSNIESIHMLEFDQESVDITREPDDFYYD